MINYKKKYLGIYLLFIVTACIYTTMNLILDTKAKNRINEIVITHPEVINGQYSEFIKDRANQTAFSFRKKDDFVKNEINMIKLTASTNNAFDSKSIDDIITKVKPSIYRLWYLQLVIFPVIPVLFFLCKSISKRKD